MPSNTPNHGFFKPDSGQDGVADELNTNLDTIDSIVQGLSGDGTSVSLQSVDTERASITDSRSSYRIKTDGTNITAVPQRDGLSEVTDTDIGTLLEEVIINQLPPTGSLIEARGRIDLTGAEFPGDLSNGTYDGVPLPSQCWIVGEVSSHDEAGSTRFEIPTTESPTRLNFSSRGIITPNVDNSQLVWAKLSGLQLMGPGAANNGSLGIDGSGQSNTWDYLELRDVNVQDCDVPINIAASGEKRINGCKFERYAGQAELRDRTFVHQSTFSPSNDGGAIRFNDTTVTSCEFDGIGEASPFVILAAETQFGYGSKFRKAGGTATGGTAISLEGDGVVVNGVRFKENPGGTTWEHCIDAYVPVGARVVNCYDGTTSTNSMRINGGGGASELVLANNNFPNGIQYLNSPSRIMRNGRSFTTAASPGSGTSQWDGNETLAYEQNITVEDRSVAAPHPQYIADSAGNWTQIG